MDELVMQLRALAGLRKLQGQPEIPLLMQAAEAIAGCRVRIVDECIVACDAERIEGATLYNEAINQCIDKLRLLKRVYG